MAPPKLDLVSIFEHLNENEETFDHFHSVPIRFRRFSHADFVLISEIIGVKWIPNEESLFVLVDVMEKPTAVPTKTPVKQEKHFCEETIVERTLTKKVFSSTFSTPKPGVVDGSPLRIKFMEMSTIRAESRSVKMIRLLSSTSGEINFFPMTAAVARGVVGLFNMQMKESNLNKLSKRSSIWMVCDGVESENIYLVGGYLKKICTNRIQSDNLIVSCRSATEPNQLPSLVSLIQQLKTKFYSSTVYSRFNVLDSETSFVSSDNDTFNSSTPNDKNAQLYLSAEWKNVSTLLENPQADAKITISMVPALFDPRSPLATSYHELKLLMVLNHGLNGSKIDWTHSTSANIDVVSKVQFFIEKVREEPNMFFANSPTFESVEAIIDSSLIVPRQNFDFTEILWQILKNCTSENMLIHCLNLVYDCFCNRTIQPKVHPGNVTPMARFIRDSYKDKLEKPTLDGSGPKRILFDIGMDKLMRDYVSFFADVKEIIPANLIEEFLRQQESSSKYLTLLKLHSCLQVFVLGRSRLDMSANSLRLLMKKAFDMVGGVSSDELENYELQTIVSTSDIKNLVTNNWVNSIWRLTLETEVDSTDHRTSTVFDIRDEFLFPFGENLMGNLFYTTILRRSNTF